MKKTKAIAYDAGMLKKFLLFMKLTIVLTCFCLLQGFSAVRGQKITLKVQNEEIAKVLTTIEKQSSYRFLFNSRLKDLQMGVSVSATDEEISNVLDQVFSGTTLVYKKLDNNLIAIRSSRPEESAIKVTGHVVNETGENLTNVSVVEKGTSSGTVTDNKGNFTLTVRDSAVLVISVVGYVDQEVPVSGQASLNVIMVRSTKTIDQVVIVGYGVSRKKDLTGSTATIKGADIANIPVVSAAQAIQGKAAGVQVVNSGAPGSAPNVRIRGTGSILGGVDPLYVVDGIITTDIRNINTADILSIDILKDASSTAIYGARAANGVVLITTKAGTRGGFTVNYNGFGGVKMLTHKVEMSGPNLFAVYSNEAAGGSPEITGADITAATNWYDALTRSAPFTNQNISVSGGGNKYRYFGSFGYLNEQGTLQGNGYVRYTVRFNHDYTVNAKLKFGNTLSFSHYTSDNKPYSLFTTAYIAAPIFAPVNPNGTFGNTVKSDVGNPWATLETTNDKSFGNRGNGTLWGEYQILSGLSFRSSFGIDLEQNNGWTYTPQYQTFLTDGTEAGQKNLAADLSFMKDSIYHWTWDNYFTYQKKFAQDHDVKVTLGHTAERRNGWSNQAIINDNNNIPKSSDGWKLNFTDTAMGQQNFRTAIDNYFRRESYFIRLNYRFKDKYLLNASFRRDANSNFPESNRWGNFPSVGVGWVISSEKFMEDQKLFDVLKLRASYGLVGNDVISPGMFDLKPTYNLYAYFGTNRVDGAIPTGIVDPDLHWEVVKEFDVGLEFSMLAKRLTGEFDFYHKNATDALYTIKLPNIGFGSSFLTNAADILNTGLEMSLGWSDKVNNNFSYTLRGNATFNTNRVESIGIGQALYDGSLNNGFLATRTAVGDPIGSFFVYKTNGIFQTDADVAAVPHLSNAKPGDFRIVDVNGDGKIDQNDRVTDGSAQPKIYYGFNAGITWKQFDFNLDIFGNAGNKVYNAKKGVRYGGNYNIEYDVAINRWLPGSNNNTFPRAYNGTAVPTDYFVESGAFVRINNATVGYTIQPKTKKLGIEKARFYVSAQNPFILTPYTGFTPELPGTPLASGIELNIYPVSASYMVGVSLTFK